MKTKFKGWLIGLDSTQYFVLMQVLYYIVVVPSLVVGYMVFKLPDLCNVLVSVTLGLLTMVLLHRKFNKIQFKI